MKCSLKIIHTSFQLLNGPGLGTMIAAMMQHVFTVSPKEVSTTVSSTTLGIFFYVSAVVSGVGGSVVFEKFGGSRLFFGMSLCCGVWCVVMVVRLMWVHHTLKKRDIELTISTIIHNELADGPVVIQNELADGPVVIQNELADGPLVIHNELADGPVVIQNEQEGGLVVI